METIKVYYSEQIDGIIFNIPESSRKLIKNAFPDKMPASRLFVDYSTKADFFSYHGNEGWKYLFDAVLGVTENELKAKGFRIEYIDAKSDKVTAA